MNLFDLTLKTARALGVVLEGTATGGAVGNIADTNDRVNANEPDDHWNGGTAWLTYDAGGAGAAPQGEMSVISDFATSGGVISVRTNFTVAPASGDKYAIAGTRYPLFLLTQKVNEAIEDIGPIEITDTSSLTTASEQTEYTLPAAVLDLREVWVQTNDDTDDYLWSKITDFSIEKEATGSGNTLIIPQQDSGQLLKLVYVGYHAELRAATDKLDMSIHVERVIDNAVVKCLLWRKAKVGEADTTVNDLLNYFQAKANQTNSRFPINQTHRKAKVLDIDPWLS